MHASTEVGRLLHDDHQDAIGVLTRFEAFLERTDDDRIASIDAPGVQPLIGDLLRLVESEVERHFDFEEQALFPLLEERGAHGLTALLAAEHRAIRPLARCLARLCADALSAGFREENWAAFKGIGQALSAQMFAHLGHEETTLLQAVDAALDPALAPGLDCQLAAAFHALRTSAVDASRPGSHRTEPQSGWGSPPDPAGPSHVPAPER